MILMELRFSVSYNKKENEKDGVVDELNSKVKNLKNEVSELEVKLRLVTFFYFHIK